MNHRKGWIWTAALLAVLVGGVSSANAVTILWGGSGHSGTDPLGNPWVALNNQGDGSGSWGIPGLYQGVLQLPGNQSFTDFHITFLDRRQGVFIDPEPQPVAPDGSDESTRFSALTDFVLWTRVISGAGTGVSFYAPAGTSLDPGETFFVNVAFTGALPSAAVADLPVVSFEASWTQDTAVPEPISAGLGCMSLIGLALAASRRRRSA
jgi:hypothetical protein